MAENKDTGSLTDMEQSAASLADSLSGSFGRAVAELEKFIGAYRNLTASETDRERGLRETNLASWARQYRDAEQQYAETAAHYGDVVAELRRNGYEKQAAMAEKARDAELGKLSESALKETALWTKLFAGVTDRSARQTRDAMDRIRQIDDYLQGKAKSLPGDLKGDSQAVYSLRQDPRLVAGFHRAVELQGKKPDGQDIDSYLEKTAESAAKLWKALDARDWKAAGDSVAQIGASLTGASGKIRELGGSLQKVFGGEIESNMGFVAATMDAVSDIGGGIADIFSMNFGKGIMGIFKGVGALFSLSSAAEKAHQKALKAIADAELAEARSYEKLRLARDMAFREGTNPFGTDELGKAINDLKVYREAVAGLRREMDGKEPQPTGNKFLDSILGYDRKKADYDEGLAALRGASIVTGHKKTGLFGWGKGKDVYTNILDMEEYKDLLGKDGRLNVDMAQSILSTRQMDDQTRKLLTTLIDLQNQADAAEAQLDTYIQNTFGDLGKGVMDALVGGLTQGTDAWQEFGKTGSKVLENLGRQIVYSLFFRDKFDKLSEQLKEVYGSGKDEKEIAADAMGVVGDFYKGIGGDMQKAQDYMKTWQEMGRQYGFDIWGDQSEAQGVSGQLKAGMTEQTGSQLVGLWNMTALDIRQLREMTEQQFGPDGAVTGDVRGIMQQSVLIEQNTRATAANTAATVDELRKVGRSLDRMNPNALTPAASRIK